MPTALFILIGCQLIGEILRDALHLPMPGPVIGMFLLAACLAIRDRHGKPGADLAPTDLRRTADTLIGHMGLLVVPAGVGIIAEADLLRQQWVAILAGLLGSTMLSLLVTGLVMHWSIRLAARRTAPPGPLADHAKLEARS